MNIEAFLNSQPERYQRVADGLMDGLTMAEIARREKISRSRVGQIRLMLRIRYTLALRRWQRQEDLGIVL